MTDSLYPDDGPSEPPRAKPHSRQKDDEAHTELVSKKLLSLPEDEEIKPGKTCTFRVVKDWGDSVEIAYVSKSLIEKGTPPAEESDAEKETAKEEMSPDEELDSIEASSKSPASESAPAEPVEA